MDQNFKNALQEAKEESIATISSKEDASRGIIEVSTLSELAQDELERRAHKTKSRKTWGRVLLVMVISGFTVSYLIIVAIGMKWLNYTDSQFAVPSVIAAGIVGTYGLAKIAVNYFFTD